MSILIDADGCPVVDLTLQIAKQFSVPMKQIQEWLGYGNASA